MVYITDEETETKINYRISYLTKSDQSNKRYSQKLNPDNLTQDPSS